MAVTEGTEANPKFRIWLGDGWPGTWVVTVRNAKEQIIVLATVKADNQAEALRRVSEAIPRCSSDEAKSWSIINAYDVADDGTVTPTLPPGIENITPPEERL